MNAKDPEATTTDIAAEIPEVEDSGSSGEQLPAVPARLEIPQGPENLFPKRSMVETLDTIASERPSGTGSAAALNLYVASYRQLADDYEELKADHRETQADLRAARADLAESEKKLAVLEERLTVAKKAQLFGPLLVFAGTAMLGLALELNSQELELYSFVAAGLGLLLIPAGWLLPFMGKR